MEQTTQQNIQKPSLPIKTKIAAWWMIIIAVILIFAGFFTLVFLKTFSLLWILSLGGVSFTEGGFFLLRNRKFGWHFSVILCSLMILLIFFLIYYSKQVTGRENYFNLRYHYGEVIELLIFFIPLILLFLDRKNFFKIAS